MMMTIMAALHTTNTTLTYTIINIWTLADSDSIVEGLREESSRIFEAHGRTWTIAGVDQMYRMDSAL